MKRTPIIIPGQVYLNPMVNEYLVVTKATRGDIQFRGPGFNGMNEVERFLERFGPVDPIDLTEEESKMLLDLLSKPGIPLSMGWVCSEDDEFDEDFNE